MVGLWLKLQIEIVDLNDSIFTCLPYLHIFDDDDDDNDDDDELFFWYGLPTKGIYPYFQPRPLSEILTIANLRHAASRI